MIKSAVIGCITSTVSLMTLMSPTVFAATSNAATTSTQEHIIVNVPSKTYPAKVKFVDKSLVGTTLHKKGAITEGTQAPQGVISDQYAYTYYVFKSNLNP